jgi:hypothetical protein
LDCSEPVNAALIYDFVAADHSTTLASSAVFAAPLTNYAMFPMLLSGWRTALNIVNDSDVAATYSITFTDSSGHVSGTLVTVPLRGHLPRFVGELLSLPSGTGIGTVEIWSQSGPPFAVTGLQFADGVFSALVPTY